MELKVSLYLTGLLGLSGFAEVGRLAHVVVHQLVQERLVCSFGEHALFFKDGEDTHRL